MRKHRFAYLPDYEGLLRQADLRSTRQMLHKRGPIITRSSSSETLRITVDGDSRRLYLKRLHVTGARRKWRGFLRNTFFGSSRIRSEWLVLLRLHDECLNPVEPIATGEIRTLRFLDHAFLITLELAGSTPLDELLPRELRRWSERDRRRFGKSLSHFVATLHDAGYVDRDLHWRNLLCVLPEDHEQPIRIGKIDSPRGSWPRQRLRRKRGALRDLAALDLHAPRYFRRTERLRFLRDYLGGADPRDLAREVLSVRPVVASREGWRPLRGETEVE